MLTTLVDKFRTSCRLISQIGVRWALCVVVAEGLTWGEYADRGDGYCVYACGCHATLNETFAIDVNPVGRYRSIVLAIAVGDDPHRACVRKRDRGVSLYEAAPWQEAGFATAGKHGDGFPLAIGPKLDQAVIDTFDDAQHWDTIFICSVMINEIDLTGFGGTW